MAQCSGSLGISALDFKISIVSHGNLLGMLLHRPGGMKVMACRMPESAQYVLPYRVALLCIMICTSFAAGTWLEWKRVLNLRRVLAQAVYELCRRSDMVYASLDLTPEIDKKGRKSSERCINEPQGSSSGADAEIRSIIYLCHYLSCTSCKDYPGHRTVCT